MLTTPFWGKLEVDGKVGVRITDQPYCWVDELQGIEQMLRTLVSLSE